MTPRISVLMPAKDTAGTIGLAVRSTLRDLPEDAELLVLDDASTDATPELLAAVRDPRLVVHRVEHSLGVATALNTLLAEARSQIIARMDADDVTLPGRFTAQLARFDQGLDMVFTSRINFGSSPRAFRPEQLGPIAEQAFPLRLAFENPLPHPSAVLRRSVLEAAGGYLPGSSEDWELWLRLLARGARGVRLARPGIAYRMHAAQITRSPSWRAARAADVPLRTAHAALMQHLGWDGPDVWAVLFDRPASVEDRATRTALRTFLATQGRALPTGQRRALQRRLGGVLPA